MRTQNVMAHYWDVQSLHAARLSKRRPKNYNGIKLVVDGIKDLMKKETDPETAHDLAEAGLIMNRLLMK